MDTRRTNLNIPATYELRDRVRKASLFFDLRFSKFVRDALQKLLPQVTFSQEFVDKSAILDIINTNRPLPEILRVVCTNLGLTYKDFKVTDGKKVYEITPYKTTPLIILHCLEQIYLIWRSAQKKDE